VPLWPFRRKPLNFREAFVQGSVALQKGRIRRALKLLKQAVALKPDHVEARVNYGSALYVSGRIEEAEAQFRAALEFDPENPYAMSNLATIYYRKGNVERAIELLEEVVRKYPDHPDVNYNLAAAYTALGDFERARAHALRELELNPGHERAKILLERLRIEEEGRNEKAPG